MAGNHEWRYFATIRIRLKQLLTNLVMSSKRSIPKHLAPRLGELIMFENPILEQLSRISPRTVLAVFIPYCLFSVYRGVQSGTDIKTGTLLFLAGILFWTFLSMSCTDLYSIFIRIGNSSSVCNTPCMVCITNIPMTRTVS